eukprot:bmy_20423T0
MAVGRSVRAAPSFQRSPLLRLPPSSPRLRPARSAADPRALQRGFRKLQRDEIRKFFQYHPV